MLFNSTHVPFFVCRNIDPAYQTMRASMHGSLSGTQNVKNTTQFQLRRFMDARSDDVNAVRSLRF
jgi:hypothetical protein